VGEQQKKLDRELIELLNELRVALPGVQVLFAFLLTVPFSQRFTTITPTQVRVYFASVLATAAATAFLIAPTAYHRLHFRERSKDEMMVTSNRDGCRSGRVLDHRRTLRRDVDRGRDGRGGDHVRLVVVRAAADASAQVTWASTTTDFATSLTSAPAW
jgi:hypothetical protein